MKRAVLVSPGRFCVEDAAPPSPGAAEALVRITAVGICGSDLHMYKEGQVGGIGIAEAGGPFVTGHECVGIIEQVGPECDRPVIGQRVAIEPAINCGRCEFCLAGKGNVCPHIAFLGLPPTEGALQQYIVHPLRLCQPLPEGSVGGRISDDAAVVLEPLATAVHALDRLDASPGRSAAVLGCGAIGLSVVLLLAHTGISPIIATDVLDYRLDKARRFGATHVCNPKRGDIVQMVTDITSMGTHPSPGHAGRGVDYVFECAGEPETMEQMVEVVCPGGRVGVVGIPSEDEMSFKHSSARRKGIDVLMIRRSNHTLGRAMEWTRRDRLPIAEFVTHHWPLEAVNEAFDTAAHYRDGVVKAVVNP